MDVARVLKSQFHAALGMLKSAIAQCPAALWADPADRTPFWRVAYHALFYAYLYLHASEKDFRPWPQHRPGHEGMADPEAPLALKPYDKSQLLEFLEVCARLVDATLPTLNLEAESGFHWLPFSKLELQIYNIRHVQQHAGELMERLGARAGIDVDWVGRMQ